MTSASIATIRYSQQVTHPRTQGLAVLLSVIATATVSSLFVATLLHAFVWKTLFPNDMAIVINTKQMSTHKNYNDHLNNKSKGIIRNSLDLMRSTVKTHQARILQRKEPQVYPDIHPSPAEQEHQQGDNPAWVDNIYSL